MRRVDRPMPYLFKPEISNLRRRISYFGGSQRSGLPGIRHAVPPYLFGKQIGHPTDSGTHACGSKWLDRPSFPSEPWVSALYLGLLLRFFDTPQSQIGATLTPSEFATCQHASPPTVVLQWGGANRRDPMPAGCPDGVQSARIRPVSFH